jgi:NTE family protein
MQKVGLVLTGGGARGAYQAGALLGIFEMVQEWRKGWPFPVITGTSAGAINAAFLAGHIHENVFAAQKLQDLWAHLSVDQIYKDDLLTLSRTGLKWVSTLSFGGIRTKQRSLSLLNTSPLRTLLEKNVSFSRIQSFIDKGDLHSLAVSALNYSSGSGQTFYQGHPDIRPWQRIRREGIPAKLTVDHVMASAAIPILFPPVQMGASFYGDGNVRNYTPCSPAINLGADKIIVIGVKKPANELKEDNHPSPSIARILSVLLNTILLDSLDLDLERIDRINETLIYVENSKALDLKKLQICTILPSENIGQMAIEDSDRLPMTLKYLLRGLGTEEEASELISYLLFVPSFTQRLIRLGYQDALRARTQLKSFFTEE